MCKQWKLTCWTSFSLSVGVDNFYDAIEDMIGYRPNPWMKWSWTIITPVLCMVRVEGHHVVPVGNIWHGFTAGNYTGTCLFQGCFVFSLVKYKPLTYNKVYEYPDWSIGLGWCLALSSMICIPMVMVIKILQSEGPLIEVAWRSHDICALAAITSERQSQHESC